MARRRRRRSPKRRSAPRRDTKAERSLASCRNRASRERDKRKQLMVAGGILAGAEIGGRFLGSKQAEMQLQGQSATRTIFGRDVDVFVGGGYAAAGVGIYGTGNKNLDTALLFGGALTIAIRRAFVSFNATSGGAPMALV